MGNSNGTTKKGSYPFVSLESFVNLSDTCDFVHYIGKGSFSSVYAAKFADEKDGVLYAIKKMSKRQIIDHNECQNALNELNILENLQHNSFIVNLHYAFQNESDLFLVTNLMLGGSLAHFMDKKPETEISTAVIQHWIAQIIIGLQFLHSNRVVHRDIKPANLLLDQNGHIRITDMNVSFQLIDDREEQSKKHEDGWGSTGFRAPEVYLRSGQGFVYACDWWSTGVVFYMLCTGKLPYKLEKNASKPNIELLRRMKYEVFDADKLDPRETQFSGIKDFCKGLLKFKPNDRIGCELGVQSEVLMLTHEFFNNLDWDLYESGRILQTKVMIKHFNSNASSTKSRLSFQQRKNSSEVENFMANFDEKIDKKEKESHIKKLWTKSSSNGSKKSSPGLQVISKEEQKIFKNWAFNHEIKQSQKTVTTEEKLQILGSLQPQTLKQYVLDSNEEQLKSIFHEMKAFREEFLEENMRLAVAHAEIEKLRAEKDNLVQQLEVKSMRKYKRHSQSSMDSQSLHSDEEEEFGIFEQECSSDEEF